MTAWYVYPLAAVDANGATIEGKPKAADVHRWRVAWRVRQPGAPGTLRRRRFTTKGEAEGFHNILVAAATGLWPADDRGWPVRPEEVHMLREAERRAASPTFDDFVGRWWSSVEGTFNSNREARAMDVKLMKQWMGEEYPELPMEEFTDEHANYRLHRRRTTNLRAAGARERASLRGKKVNTEPLTCSPRTEQVFAQTRVMVLRAAAGRGILQAAILDSMRLRGRGRTVWSSRMTLNQAEVAHLAQLMAGHQSGQRYTALIVLAGTAGLRPGELAALKVDDMFLDAPTPFVRVSDSGTQKPGEARLKHRQVGGWRDVPLVPHAVDELREHISSGWTSGERLFSSPEGERLDLHNFTAQYWKPVAEPYARRLGKPIPANVGMRFLRKAAITWWLDSGVDVYTAAKWAGHSPTVLLEYYACATESLNTQAVGKLLG